MVRNGNGRKRNGGEKEAGKEENGRRRGTIYTYKSREREENSP